jgi:hypothetical protein
MSFSFISSADTGFNDVSEKSWCFDYVKEVTDSKILGGYEDGTFKPEKNLTVREFTAMVAKVLERTYIYSMFFNLTTSDDYIPSAIKLNLVSEEDFTDLDNKITRGEMARIIVKAVKFLDEYPELSTGSYPACLGNIDDYKGQIKDFEKIPSMYKQYMLVAFAKGIVTGYNDGTVKAKNNLNRAEACKVIFNILDKNRRQELEIQKYLSLESHRKEYKFVAGETKFTFELTSTGTMLPGKTTVTISEGGDFEHVNYSNDLRTSSLILDRKITKKLTRDQILSFFNFIMNDIHFFILPGNMITENFVSDSAFSSIKVAFNGEIHKIGGYHPYYSDYFVRILNKLSEFEKK